jgi:hypothetical protein
MQLWLDRFPFDRLTARTKEACGEEEDKAMLLPLFAPWKLSEKQNQAHMGQSLMLWPALLSFDSPFQQLTARVLTAGFVV